MPKIFEKNKKKFVVTYLKNFFWRLTLKKFYGLNVLNDFFPTFKMKK